MPVPKRKHSKRRTRIKRNAHYKRKPVNVKKTKSGTGYKRPHVDEKVEV